MKKRSNKRRYAEIHRAEFESFLESFCVYAEFDRDHYKFDFIEESPGKWMRVDGQINEHCYYVAVDLDREYCLKLYSSISRKDHVSRAVGVDAIRVVVASSQSAKPLRRSLPKVKRIKTWRKNLSLRMSEALRSLGINTTCPLCDNPLVLRKNSSTRSVFLGCSKYPDCVGNRRLPTYISRR